MFWIGFVAGVCITIVCIFVWAWWASSTKDIDNIFDGQDYDGGGMR